MSCAWDIKNQVWKQEKVTMIVRGFDKNQVVAQFKIELYPFKRPVRDGQDYGESYGAYEDFQQTEAIETLARMAYAKGSTDIRLEISREPTDLWQTRIGLHSIQDLLDNGGWLER